MPAFLLHEKYTKVLYNVLRDEVMNRLYKKSILLVAIVVLMSSVFVQASRANIIDDFLKAIGISSEKEEMVKESIENVNQEVEKYLDERQKEVVSKIEDIYSDIQNVNLDELAGSLDYKLPTQIMSNLNDFFKNYNNGLINLKSILGIMKYKIEDVRNEGNRVIAKITYTYPAIPKLITKVLPEIIMKNASILFGAEINNDTIDSALGSIKKELDKGSYEVETFTREFVFEQFGEDWKMVKVDDIVKDATKYINDIGKSFLK